MVSEAAAIRKHPVDIVSADLQHIGTALENVGDFSVAQAQVSTPVFR